MSDADRLLPRDQQGARSQQLLIVLLGDYWHLRAEPVPSAALVALLEAFGVTAAGARAAIQRLAKRGFLVSAKAGRTTSYSVSATSRERVDAHVEMLFRSHIPRPWDGDWTVVGYTLREDQRSTRNALRERLRAAGFGSTHDGLWIRPGDHRDEVDAMVADVPEPPAAGQLTVFTGARLPDADAAGVARDAFGLDELAAAYEGFAAQWAPVAARIRPPAAGDASGAAGDASGTTGDASGAVGDAVPMAGQEALRLRTSIMRDWRELRHRDPMLPQALLDPDFPFERALAVCAAVYDTIGPTAETAFRGILQPHAPELVRFVSHHTFAAFDLAPPSATGPARALP